MQVEAFGRGAQRLADLLQHIFRNAGFAAAVAVLRRRRHAGPAPIQPVGAIGQMRLGGVEFLVQPLVERRLHRRDVGVGDGAFGDQLLAVELQGGRMILDHPVHLGLGEGRLVRFVVTESAIADHVEHDVLVEQLAEFGGDARGMHHRFRIVAIHMEDRRLHHQRHVGGVRRGARIDRRGGEADLVVDDEMDGAAGAEALGARGGETFRHHALAGRRPRRHGSAAAAREARLWVSRS